MTTSRQWICNNSW